MTDEYTDLPDGDEFTHKLYVYVLNPDLTHYDLARVADNPADSWQIAKDRLAAVTQDDFNAVLVAQSGKPMLPTSLIFPVHLGEHINEDGTPYESV